MVLNGGLNLSVLDGWWAEAYDGLNGFAIGDGTTHTSTEEQDRRDAESLYRVIEETALALYYDRDEYGVPRRWCARMKQSLRTLGWRFNTDRMVMDYTRECYLPAAGTTSCQMPQVGLGLIARLGGVGRCGDALPGFSRVRDASGPPWPYRLWSGSADASAGDLGMSAQPAAAWRLGRVAPSVSALARPPAGHDTISAAKRQPPVRESWGRAARGR